MGMPGHRGLLKPLVKTRLLIAALAVILVAVGPASGAPPVPNPVGPADGAEVVFLPSFAWDAVAGADKYQFQLAADQNFNSPLFNITTKNTRATPDKTVPNGTYYWRVASVDSAGSVSNWSPVMSVVKLWADRPTLSTPVDGATISYPADPLVLRWTAVPGAAKYRVYLARDATLGSLVTSNGQPWEVQATNLAPNVLLASNTYYWAVTPLDAQGNPGDQSPIRSLNWVWPSTTTPSLTDLAPSTEHFDPQFAWNLVPGAARYEVEVNSDSNFDPASKVCCTDKPISTTLTPLEVFENNTYYWRVRAIDRAGNAGIWNQGPTFVKRFDNYPDLSEEAVKDLRMRDANDPGTDLQAATPGYQTDTPILTWDPVPGAASYQVDVVPFEVVVSGDPQCNWTASTLRRWTVPTASTSWTPLGSQATTIPFSTGHSVNRDNRSLVPDESYCARVRARSGRVSLFDEIWGDYTFLGNGSTEPSFTFTGFPTGDVCQGCYAGYLGTDDYLSPIRGTTLGANPLFTWKPIVGKNSYWVIVAKDPSFSTIIDYAITRVPAYAVRTRTQPITYEDEETSYYWVILPASGIDGGGAPGNPAFGAYADFQKQTTPPNMLAPADGTTFTGQPTFRWDSTVGARRYYIQIDDETTFSFPYLDDQRTASTAYTSLKTYQSARTYYWRVAPEDENNKGLTWSATRSFQISLPAPVMDTADFGTAEAPPVISWSAVPGAVSYTLDVQEPDGDHNQFTGFPSTASSWQTFTGVGIMTLKVRAEFPTSSTVSTVSGPWSDLSTFTHTIREPLNPGSDAGQNRLLLSWDAKTGMKNYKVQISAREDFSPYIENRTTDNPRFAPTLISSTYAAGGHFWWRVAAVDADGNTGDWATRTFDLPPLSSGAPPPTASSTFRLSSSGRLVKGRYKTVYIYVNDASSLAAVRFASVRASGAGVKTTTVLSNSTGAARFYLKPTRLGTVTFRVSKSGYTTAYLYKKVRRP
jgi:hypothetical protein